MTAATVIDVLSYITGGVTYHMVIVDVAGEKLHTDGYFSEKGNGSLKKASDEIMRRWPETDKSQLDSKLTFIHFMNTSRGQDSSGADYPRKLS